MRNRPDARELLEAAERMLSGEVATDLSNRQRYNVALITSALGIARRELGNGQMAWPEELAALKALYGADGTETDERALHRLNRKFAADLRAGVYDETGKTRLAAQKLLREDVLARLAEDNPGYVK